MSTWHYLECVSHDPPLRSESEIEQHVTEFLDEIRTVVRSRPIQDGMYPEPWKVLNTPAGESYDIHDWWRVNAVEFCAQHPTCRIALVTEYGDREEIA